MLSLQKSKDQNFIGNPFYMYIVFKNVFEGRGGLGGVVGYRNLLLDPAGQKEERLI
jgi:hypothetical protein